MPNVTRRNRGMNVLACFAMRDQKRCDLRETACRWLYATHSRTRNSAHFPLMGSFGKATLYMEMLGRAPCCRTVEICVAGEWSRMLNALNAMRLKTCPRRLAKLGRRLQGEPSTVNTN